MTSLEKVSPTVASLTSGSYKSALPGVAGAAVGYVAWRKFFPKRGFHQHYKAEGFGAVAGVVAVETFKGEGSKVGNALGLAGAAFLPTYLRKVGGVHNPLRGEFMSNIGNPVLGYVAGKLVASLLGK